MLKLTHDLMLVGGSSFAFITLCIWLSWLWRH